MPRSDRVKLGLGGAENVLRQRREAEARTEPLPNRAAAWGSAGHRAANSGATTSRWYRPARATPDRASKVMPPILLFNVARPA